MEQESADEFAGIQSHDLFLIVIAAVLIGKGNLFVINGFYSFIGYGHAVRVAAKIFKYLLGSGNEMLILLG